MFYILFFLFYYQQHVLPPTIRERKISLRHLPQCTSHRGVCAFFSLYALVFFCFFFKAGTYFIFLFFCHLEPDFLSALPHLSKNKKKRSQSPITRRRLLLYNLLCARCNSCPLITSCKPRCFLFAAFFPLFFSSSFLVVYFSLF